MEGLDVPREGKESRCIEGRVSVGRRRVLREEAGLHAELGVTWPVWSVLASEDLLNV